MPFITAAKELLESTDCPLFQQYLILLIKLQLNVADLDLAYTDLESVKLVFQGIFTSG